MWASDRRRTRCRIVAAVVWASGALVLASTAIGQVPPSVTDADIERARQSHRMPTDAVLTRIPVPAAPRIDALPQPATKAPIDLEALAKGFNNDAAQPAFAAKAGPTLLVFISFAMPEATIGRLLDQAERAGATLVLRGLVNGSLRDTVERMQRLIGERRVAVQIDPQAFDRFSIVRTPSFVLVRGGASAQPCSSGTCLTGDQFVMAAGDVSLEYALSFFERSVPAMARDASSFLRRMKGAPR